MPPLPPNCPPPPGASDRPRPTIADIPLPPRRPLRDGTSSSASSAAGSRGRSRSVASRSRSAGAGSRSGSHGAGGRGRAGVSVNAVVEGMLSEAGAGAGAGTGTRAAGEREIREGSNGASVVNSRTVAEEREHAGLGSESDSSSSGIVAISPIPRLRQPPARASANPLLPQIPSSTAPTPSATAATADTATATTATTANNTRRTSYETISSSSDEPLGRRFTAREKGKGRAPPEPAIEIGSDNDTDSASGLGSRSGSVSGSSVGALGGTPRRGAGRAGDGMGVVGVKRKRRGGKEVAEEEEEDGEEGEEEGMEEKRLGTGFMCPVCFSPPNPAIITPCGHILCAGCLHSSLAAAIRRNPNPFPDAGRRGGAGQRGRGARRGRGANRGRGAAHAHDHSHAHANGSGGGHPSTLGPGPDHWTEATLRAAFIAARDVQVDRVLSARGWAKEMWASVKEAMFGDDGTGKGEGGGDGGDEELEVKEVLRGLWMIGGRWWVVEGECPVCRKPLPGGYGPVGSGIGGIVPLEIKVSSAASTRKKRRLTPTL